MFNKSKSKSETSTNQIEMLLHTLLTKVAPEFNSQECILRGQKIEYMEALQHTTTQILEDLKTSTISHGQRIGDLETFQGYVEKQEFPKRLSDVEYTTKDLSKSFEQLNESLTTLVKETTETNKQTTNSILLLNNEFKESLQKIIVAAEKPKAITSKLEQVGAYLLQACILGVIFVMFEIWKSTP